MEFQKLCPLFFNFNFKQPVISVTIIVASSYTKIVKRDFLDRVQVQMQYSLEDHWLNLSHRINHPESPHVFIWQFMRFLFFKYFFLIFKFKGRLTASRRRHLSYQWVKYWSPKTSTMLCKWRSEAWYVEKNCRYKYNMLGN